MRLHSEPQARRELTQSLCWRAPSVNAQRTQVVELAVKNRLPAIYSQTEFVEAGGLMTYGVSFTDLFRRAATYVDKILKGAKPADLPVEQPMKFEFIVNLKAAKQIGLTIPPNVLARADRVIREDAKGMGKGKRKKWRTYEEKSYCLCALRFALAA